MRCGLLAILLLFSCGDDAGDTGDGIDAGQSANTQGFTCNAGQVDFPAVDKTCDTPSDCTFLTHTVDCCGNSVVVGVNAGDSDAIASFETAEGQCSAMFPGCGCPAGPSEAEDGNSGTPSLISVDCVENRCVTFVEGS
jgi:hypothetical protein